MKIYEVKKCDAFRHTERVAMFTSRVKVVGFMVGLLTANKEAFVKTIEYEFLYDLPTITTKNLMNRAVVNRGEFGSPEYYAVEVEVL